jgi:16S rRNA (guanine(966)-N(2))-methyltransferase RsmD
LFSILGDQTIGARFLDLYAGTGAIGIEALSRGAAVAVFIEPDRHVLRVLRANLARCELGSNAIVHSCTAETFLRPRHGATAPYDIIFADPPYHDESCLKLLPSLNQAGIMAPHSIVILEHFNKVSIPPEVGSLIRLRQYRYGDTVLTKFGVRNEGEHPP